MTTNSRSYKEQVKDSVFHYFCENPDVIKEMLNGNIDTVEDWTQEEGCIVDCPYVESDEAKENVLANLSEVIQGYRLSEADTTTFVDYLDANKWESIDSDARYHALMVYPIVREVWTENEEYFKERASK